MPILTALAVGAVAGMLLSGNESETQQESLTNIANTFTSSINNSVDNSLSVDTNVFSTIFSFFAASMDHASNGLDPII